MRHFPRIAALLGLLHWLAVACIVFLSQIAVFQNLYLGLFGSSESIGTFFLFILQPLWFVHRFIPDILHHLSPPLGFLLLQALSSALYGILGALLIGAVLPVAHRNA